MGLPQSVLLFDAHTHQSLNAGGASNSAHAQSPYSGQIPFDAGICGWNFQIKYYLYLLSSYLLILLTFSFIFILFSVSNKI